jgi:hypothetical protein
MTYVRLRATVIELCRDSFASLVFTLRSNTSNVVTRLILFFLMSQDQKLLS